PGEIRGRWSPVVLATRAARSAGRTCIICSRPTRCWGRRCCRCTMSPSTCAWWPRRGGPSPRGATRRSGQVVLPGGGNRPRIFDSDFCFLRRPPLCGRHFVGTTMFAWLVLLAEGDAQQPPGGGGLSFLFPMLLIFFVFYFLVLRPMKRQEAERATKMMSTLKKG